MAERRGERHGEEERHDAEPELGDDEDRKRRGEAPKGPIMTAPPPEARIP